MDTNNLSAGRASHLPADRHQGTATTRARVERARFRIEGLGSALDAERLERRLARQVGVIGAAVNPIVECAYVAYDPSLTSVSLIQRQIEFTGFRAKAQAR